MDANALSAKELTALASQKANEENALNTELKNAETKLKGRAYYWNSSDQYAVYLNMTYFSSIAITYRGLVYKGRVMSVIVSRNTRRPDCTICRKAEDYGVSFNNVCDLLLYVRGEIPVKLFKRLWDDVKVGAEVYFSKFTEGLLEVHAEYHQDTDQLPDDEKAYELDVPFYQMEGGDCTLLPKAFQLPGNRYLMTPASRKYAIKELEEAHEQLYRGSQYFEECDMRYVTSRTDHIYKLTTIMKVV